MKILEVLKGVRILEIRGDENVCIKNLSQKVEDCKEDSLFFCYKGVNFDGHDYINDAVKNGAVCILCERFIENCKLLQIRVKNVRGTIFKVCSNFYGKFYKKMKFIGITGTNGKTTTATIFKNILECSGKKTCLIGTNGVEIGQDKFDSGFTTPDTVGLFKILKRAYEKGANYVVMEVSAHAIDLKKVKGIKFDVGIFTNLTQDHLDYFGSMHKYALTKLKFLKKSYCKNVVINTDDEHGKLFVKLTNCKVFSYGIDNPSENFAMDLDLKKDGSTFLLNVLDCVLEIKTSLICKFNVYNILACCVGAKIFGIDIDSIVNGIEKTKIIDGRVNVFNLKNGAKVIIDYAHTPDGFEKILENLRKINYGKRILTVFGCGGNRDKTKRQKMGEIAYLYSDKIFVTSDNPRWEDEKDIIADILKGIKGKAFVDTNRRKAIEEAIKNSSSGDIIVILGKGNEKYQEIKGVKIPFSDKDIIKNFLLKQS